MIFEKLLPGSAAVPHNLLYGWGDNCQGEIGNLSTGTAAPTSSPVSVKTSGVQTWKQVATGINFSIGLKTDGTLWGWGSNFYGNLGTSTLAGPALSPTSIASALSWTKVSSGSSYSMGIKSDGSLWSWGYNGSGQLGQNITAGLTTSSPTQIGSSSWNAIAAGDTHALGITITGALYAWGNGSSGQRGDLSIVSNQSSPVLVSGPAGTSWSIVAAGVGGHSLAITTLGALYAWGTNANGQLGIGTITNVSSPVQVGTSSWNAIAAGVAHSLGITVNGNLYAWGIGNAGQLGNLAITNQSSPVLVSGPAGTSWSIVAAGNSHSHAISTLGKLYAWGLNTSGQLGINSVTNVSSPVLVSGPVGTSWNAIGCETNNSFGITTLGVLYGWGSQSFGAVGINVLSAGNIISPVLVSGPVGTSWSIIGASKGNFILGITTTGSLYGWGENSFNQLAYSQSFSSPVQIGSSSWSFVSAGSGNVLAIDTLGVLYGWGFNNTGQVGILVAGNNNSWIYTPTKVSCPVGTSWSMVSCGQSTSYGITTVGALYAWGAGGSGQLGNASIALNVSSPILVSGPAATSWSIVESHPNSQTAYAITTLGVLYAWGVNTSGQVGNLTITNVSSPVLVSGPAGTSWSIVAAGSGHGLAITISGVLYAWGVNTSGQVGNSTITNVSSPVLVSAPAGMSWTIVEGGTGLSFAINTSGILYTWGVGTLGVQGTTTTSSKSSPVLVSAPAGLSFVNLSAVSHAIAISA